jgi:hypothetical protein
MMRRASSTTWLLVTMTPSARTMTPEPGAVLYLGRRRRARGDRRRRGRGKGMSAPRASRALDVDADAHHRGERLRGHGGEAVGELLHLGRARAGGGAGSGTCCGRRWRRRGRARRPRSRAARGATERWRESGSCGDLHSRGTTVGGVPGYSGLPPQDYSAEAISSTTRRAASEGSAASRMGRPTTRCEAPARMASVTVAVRCWSSPARSPRWGARRGSRTVATEPRRARPRARSGRTPPRRRPPAAPRRRARRPAGEGLAAAVWTPGPRGEHRDAQDARAPGGGAHRGVDGVVHGDEAHGHAVRRRSARPRARPWRARRGAWRR